MEVRQYVIHPTNNHDFSFAPDRRTRTFIPEPLTPTVTRPGVRVSAGDSAATSKSQSGAAQSWTAGQMPDGRTNAGQQDSRVDA